MNATNREVILLGPLKPLIVKGLEAIGTLHKSAEAKDLQSFYAAHPGVRAIACAATSELLGDAFMRRFPKLQIISSFGVGYDHIDAKWAGAHGIIVTNTPDVLERGGRRHGARPAAVHGARISPGRTLSARRQVGAEALSADARRRCATAPSAWSAWAGSAGPSRAGSTRSGCRSSIIRAARSRTCAYRHYPNLIAMARDVDVLLVIVPGGAETRNMVNAEVLDALGPNGILINMARGSVVDEQALIAALQDKKICAAGLDVFANEPKVPKELIEMDNVVLFPHLGSASVHTRAAMDQLVVDNLGLGGGKAPAHAGGGNAVQVVEQVILEPVSASACASTCAGADAIMRAC